MKAPVSSWTNAEKSRLERLRSNQRRPAKAVVEVVDREELPPVWQARRRNGTAVVICALHLLEDDNLVDVTPAGEGSGCDRCTQFVELSHHAVSRWLERVGGRSMLEASNQLLEFLSSAFTAFTTPRWIRTTPVDAELLLNVRWQGVCLLKRNGAVLTVLTSAGPRA